MIAYLKMKRNEWKVKAYLYGMIANVIDNQKDIIAVLEKLYVALKDDIDSIQAQTKESTE